MIRIVERNIWNNLQNRVSRSIQYAKLEQSPPDLFDLQARTYFTIN